MRTPIRYFLRAVRAVTLFWQDDLQVARRWVSLFAYVLTAWLSIPLVLLSQRFKRLAMLWLLLFFFVGSGASAPVTTLPSAVDAAAEATKSCEGMGPAEAFYKERYAVVFPSRTQEMLFYLRFYGLPRWVARVAILESGYRMDSRLARALNNPFGMDHPYQRETTSQGPVGRFASYCSLEDAVQDYKLWIAYSPPAAGEDFRHYLRRRGYNPFPAYYHYIGQINLAI